MYHVYLLRSIKNPVMTYAGFTAKDVRARMDEHHRGLTKTTAPQVPWQIEVVVPLNDRQRAEEFESRIGLCFCKKTLLVHASWVYEACEVDRKMKKFHLLRSF
ncbi:GIY-YIG nuclease family protein [Candidatus Peregrinibacteria bacterium]|nr:GIY-YIG nuclease family protein [Candidatus Peregrinibacteria bacterium]MBI3816791.1 GIY-YIG nuclease family protein [Candidatus Peregrinibacteria bacterium]